MRSEHSPSPDWSARWLQIAGALEGVGLDAVIVAGRGVLGEYGRLQYITGYRAGPRPMYAVLRPGSKPVLLLPTFVDKIVAESSGAVTDLVVAPTTARSDYIALIARTALSGRSGRTRIGIVGAQRVIPANDYLLLKDAVSGELVDATAQVDSVRVRKTLAEQWQLRDAARIAESCLRVFGDQLKAGASLGDAALKAEVEGRLGGGTHLIALAGVGPFFGAPTPATHVTEGDLITVFVELANADGYWVELGALFAAGRLNADRSAIANACLELLARTQEGLRKGGPIASLSTDLGQRLRQFGFESTVGIGHSIGLDEEVLSISETEMALIEPGMAFAAHPSVRDHAGRCGAALANSFIVGEKQVEPLSSYPLEIHPL